jgi:hypothetical protein
MSKIKVIYLDFIVLTFSIGFLLAFINYTKGSYYDISIPIYNIL